MSLADALRRAQSGYRSDVSNLVEQLRRSNLYAPLEAGANLPETPTTLTSGTPLRLHNVRSGDGSAWLPLFSSVDTLRHAGTRHGWTTDGGPLRFVSFRWDDAIAGMFRQVVTSSGNAGVVFDWGSASELALNAGEVISIADGTVIPLVGYAANQPTRGNEEVFVGEPATAPPPELVDAVRSALAGEEDVRSYALRQFYMPERDVMPHLVLDIECSAPEPQRQRIAQRVGQAVEQIRLDPPGYMDIMFNLSRSS
jgi:type III secretion system (T3SS) SseB-like protein